MAHFYLLYSDREYNALRLTDGDGNPIPRLQQPVRPVIPEDEACSKSRHKRKTEEHKLFINGITLIKDALLAALSENIIVGMQGNSYH